MNLLGQNKPLRGDLSAMYRASSWRLNSDFKAYFHGISIAERRDDKSGNKDISYNLSFSRMHVRIIRTGNIQNVILISILL